MDTIYTEVEREKYYSTPAELAKHIRAIGYAIVEDSANLFIPPNSVKSITITAELNPCETITCIKYELTRIADPRFEERKGNCDGEF